jgi:hypothetical protein
MLTNFLSKESFEISEGEDGLAALKNNKREYF